MTNREVVEKIKKASKIAIFSHQNPDPDACGSVFALRDVCSLLGVESDVILKKIEPNYLNDIFPIYQAKNDFKIDDYDLVIFADMHMVNRMEEEFKGEASKASNVLIIDHHDITETDFNYESYVIKPEYASTTQIITEIIRSEALQISAKTAKYLYAGLIGDTDRFLYSNLTKEVFETAMFLLERGADIQGVYDFMYRYKTKEQISVNKFIYKNLKFTKNGRCAYIVVTQKDLKKMKADIEDVKFFSNELVCIKDVELSFLVIEYKKNFFKVSLRSIAGVSTLPLATKYGGGGHICASGFSVDMKKIELMRRIPKWAKEILNG